MPDSGNYILLSGFFNLDSSYFINFASNQFNMKSICVYCASSLGSNPIYSDVAFELGQFLALNNIVLVYGGAKVGLMGKLADGVHANNGKVIGVIPQFLKSKEVAHESLFELITVETMHERKALMQEKSDGFIALPGGFGTMEELFEILTWAQLGLHHKPIGILNTNNYYQPLLQLVENMINEGLLKAEFKKMLLVSDDIEDLLNQMKAYESPYVSKWEGSKIM